MDEYILMTSAFIELEARLLKILPSVVHGESTITSTFQLIGSRCGGFQEALLYRKIRNKEEELVHTFPWARKDNIGINYILK